MPAKRNHLKAFSTPELIEEIARRANETDCADDVTFCDDCRHYLCAESDPVCDGKYTPCALRHSVKFKMPESPTGDFGFYRKVCADRDVKTDPLGGASK